jgi:ubiquinone/menaquinone biosynthesis C-methylase UbiE
VGIIDKKNILSDISEVAFTELELGCGSKKHNLNAVGVDMLDYPDVDIVGDIYEVLASFPDMSVNVVRSYHFIEHVPDVPRLLSELARVVKPNGILEFVAPHFSNPYFYSDPTHRSFFGLYTFCYYSNNSPFARLVPNYGHKPDFGIEKIDLIFKSTQPFVFRYGIKKLIGKIINSCIYIQELYEENFCYLFPCYEVRYILRRHNIDL